MADVDELHFVVEGDPVGKGRPRFTRSGHVFTPQKTRSYESRVGVACRSAMAVASVLGPFDGAVEMRVTAFFPIPKSATKAKRESALQGLIRPSKPDIDNVGKAILDGCNGIAYKDDAQVQELHVEKLYGERPRVEVSIRPLQLVGVGFHRRKG